MPRTRMGLALLVVLGVAAPASSMRLEMCGNRPNTSNKTCLVDGDTLWLHGENIRLKGFDAPEPKNQICGGEFEVNLARFASARMLQLLNSGNWTIERFGFDTTNSRRTLATIRIEGQDVGDILIADGLARRWPDGKEWWCDSSRSR